MRRVTRLLALALDLPADHFEQYFRTPLLTLRPIHYTAELSSPTEGVLGAGAHTDWVRGVPVLLSLTTRG